MSLEDLLLLALDAALDESSPGGHLLSLLVALEWHLLLSEPDLDPVLAGPLWFFFDLGLDLPCFLLDFLEAMELLVDSELWELLLALVVSSWE